jgi:chromosome segregation protein
VPERAAEPKSAAKLRIRSPALGSIPNDVFLRSLTLRGFKSFADRTVLEFAPGVSVIVGPNGSGKSNIADAISWVLGEQGVRALRGAQMADVIFAGSPVRAGLGMAEVTLVIDNTAELIKVPASEIEISRSILRSGESEYKLGGRPCRLIDIQEMLSDAGLGRAQHAVVGQGQLEDVLGARPEERRQFIEEAAGIAKHRRRRERAERRLTGMEGDLKRVQDLVGELRRQLKPLEKQAELAARHEELTAEAAALSVRIAAARLRELLAERDRRRPEWERAEEDESTVRAGMAELDARIVVLEQERAEAEADETLAGEEHAGLQAAKSALESEVRTAIRWEASARERLSVATGNAGRLFGLEEELRLTEAALADAAETFAVRESTLASSEEEYRAQERARRELEELHRTAGAEAAARLAQAETLRQSLATAEAERERLGRMLGEIGAGLAREIERGEGLGGEVERLDALSEPLTADATALADDVATLSRELAGLEATDRELTSRREALEARAAELAESPGSAFAKRRAGRPIGLVSELIEAPRPYEAALRGALGAFADALAYASMDDVLAEVPAADGGPGLILALADGPDVRPSIAGERSLLDLVKVDARIRGLASSLLAEHYLVSNLAEAQAKRRVHPSATFVTEAGVVVGTGWVRTPTRTGAGVESLRREIGSVERELASVNRRLREGRARLQEVEERQWQVRAELEDLDRRIGAAVEEMSKSATECAALRRQEELVTERLNGAVASVTATRARITALEAGGVATGAASLPDLPPRPEPPVALRVEVESLRRERGRLEGGVSRMHRQIEEIRAEDPESLRETVGTAAADRAAADERLRDASAALDAVVVGYRAATVRARGAREAHADANRAWRDLAERMEHLRTEHENLNRARAEMDGRIADAERTLRDGHGADPSESIGALDPEDSVETLQRRADLVARRLGLLGRVNLLASGELGELRERHAFLVRELDDIKAARSDLEHVIVDVDRQMREMFVSAFDDVAAEFTQLFALLFPGGEGRLVLTDPSDPLVAGVEVEARPGRKRVRRLSLLSGGERSLAALAFLVAIFRARPSPFYLLDEVEAALDDVNLHRFLDVIATLADASQVLVVTHQKRTMEMADALYGVTMGADGTSKVIAQRLQGSRGRDGGARDVVAADGAPVVLPEARPEAMV